MGPYSTLNLVLDEVGREVMRAKEQWGEEFDEKNTLNDWVMYSHQYSSRATAINTSLEQQESDLRKAAGILISAIDMLKRKGFAPRHYESQSRPKSSPEVDTAAFNYDWTW